MLLFIFAIFIYLFIHSLSCFIYFFAFFSEDSLQKQCSEFYLLVFPFYIKYHNITLSGSRCKVKKEMPLYNQMKKQHSDGIQTRFLRGL